MNKQNNKNTFDIAKQLREKFPKAVHETMNRTAKTVIDGFVDAAKNAYITTKQQIETTMLRNDENTDAVIRVITTKIIVDENDRSATVSIVAPGEVETKVLHAAEVGTGIGVDEDILKFFDVRDDKKRNANGEATNYIIWYFEPKDLTIHYAKLLELNLKNQLRQNLG